MGYDRIVYIRYHFSCGLDRKDACWLSFTPLTGFVLFVCLVLFGFVLFCFDAPGHKPQLLLLLLLLLLLVVLVLVLVLLLLLLLLLSLLLLLLLFGKIWKYHGFLSSFKVPRARAKTPLQKASFWIGTTTLKVSQNHGLYSMFSTC